MSVAVLFARSDSIYKKLSGSIDVYDIERNALNFNGSSPVIAHPPCRGWGRLRQFAKPRDGEKELAFFAIDKIRENGGVLEHPMASSLFKTAGLPLPGQGVDDFGGFSIDVSQKWWGHKAEKKTWLYICGVAPDSIPDFPITLGAAEYVCGSSGGQYKRKEISKADRERTPVDFAKWLIKLAQTAAKK